MSLSPNLWYHAKGLVTSNRDVQYESLTSSGKKVKVKVKVFVYAADADTRAVTLASRTFVTAR